MAERLVVTCKNCGKEFDSPIQMDRESFKTGQLVNNSYQCPHCGEMRSYDKPDHSFRTS